MFTNNYICIQKHRLKGHMAVLHMLQLKIMFTIMSWHFLIRQLFYYYKTFTFIQMLSTLFWDFFGNIISEIKKNKMDETPSSIKWDLKTCLLFKRFILKYQYRLTLRQMPKKRSIIKKKRQGYINLKLDIWHIQW